MSPQSSPPFLPHFTDTFIYLYITLYIFILLIFRKYAHKSKEKGIKDKIYSRFCLPTYFHFRYESNPVICKCSSKFLDKENMQ